MFESLDCFFGWRSEAISFFRCGVLVPTGSLSSLPKGLFALTSVVMAGVLLALGAPPSP